MKTEDRIVQAPACTVINLTEPEKDVYHGAGRKLAKFDLCTLVELFDLLDYHNAEEALTAAVQFADADDVWLVMCSCYQLCEPRRIRITDAGDVAHLARVIGDEFAKWEKELEE